MWQMRSVVDLGLDDGGKRRDKQSSDATTLRRHAGLALGGAGAGASYIPSVVLHKPLLTYGYGPSIEGPGYVGNSWGYDLDTYGFDGWSDYDLPPPAPNPVGPSKTIDIPQDRGK